MSKKKKTIEELMEEALIPEEEHLYEIPDNWVWVKLKTINKNKKRNIEPNKFSDETFELYSVPSYPEKSPEIVKGEEIGSSKQLVNNNEVLLCKINPRINRVWKVYDNTGKYRQLASTEWIVISENRVVYPNYLLYLLKSTYFRKLLTSNVSGVGGSLTRARPKEVENYPIAIPPFNEQKRIAEKVERLLNKIDEAKQLIEEAKETFELRRAAILDKAFRGELTRKWRRENNSEDILNYITSLKTITNLKKNGDILEPYALPSGWRWARIGDLFHVQVGSTPSRKNVDYWEGGLPWLSSGEVQFNTINESREHVTDLAVKECRLKLAPKGSILFGMIGEGKTRGQVALLNLDAFHNQNIASIWVSNTKISSLYVYYWLVSQYSKNRQNSAGNNQPAYNKSRVQELLIPIAPIAEIEVIVNQLQRLLESEINVNKLLSLEETLTDIKQSILSKAFRGELGTNDPSEENAIELLKEVLQEQVK